VQAYRFLPHTPATAWRRNPVCVACGIKGASTVDRPPRNRFAGFVRYL